MAAKFIKVDPFDLVVFGGTGDLAYRKLYPALFHRDKSEQFTEPTRIIGVSRRHMERAAFRASVREALTKYNDVDAASAETVERFALTQQCVDGRRPADGIERPVANVGAGGDDADALAQRSATSSSTW